MQKNKYIPVEEINILGSRVAISPEGKVALVLDTSEIGTLSFYVKLPVVLELKATVAQAETFLLGPVS